MDEVIEKSVERVIRAMRENLGDQITIDDMARTAMFSKFHFSRIFQRVTGISPGRFLSALRLQEAKRLLLATSLTVADISHLVGYNSIGTFSSRFRSSVGVSPTEYRQFRGFVVPLPNGLGEQGGRTRVRGQVWSAPRCRPAHIVVGLFPDRIMQGSPVRHATIDGTGPFALDDVPEGTWYLMACSAEVGVEPDAAGFLAVSEVYVGGLGPIDVRDGVPARAADLWLRPRHIFDPPALLAQLDQPMWTLATDRAPTRAEAQAALPGA